jgi:gas vesicle protein
MKILWFIAGVGVGATVSLFVAPTSGAQMREVISDAASAAVEVAEGRLEDLKEQAQGVVEDAKKATEEAEAASAQVRTSANLHSEAS